MQATAESYSQTAPETRQQQIIVTGKVTSGATGVIMITTKSGWAGESKISYDGYYGVQQASKYINDMNLREYASYYNEMAELGFTAQREEFYDPSLLGEGTDWQDEIFRVWFVIDQSKISILSIPFYPNVINRFRDTCLFL